MLAYFIPQTGLADWTHGLSWKQLLNNNPGIIHLLQHWRHHYRTITIGTALSYKSDDTSACTNQLKYTCDTHVLAVIKRDRGYCCSIHVFLCCFSSVRAVVMSQIICIAPSPCLVVPPSYRYLLRIITGSSLQL